jgi:type II secretory pathway pseudopilin PulG
MIEEQKKKTLGLAIGSLVCGCFFIIPLIGLILGIVAIVLGIIALVTISKNSDTLKGKGLAIAGIVMGGISVIIMPIIALLAAIAIPNLMRARIHANEAAAVASLRTISMASDAYRSVQGYYPNRVEELTSTSPPYISEDFASGARQGYIFSIVDTNSTSTFLATALPENKGTTGSFSFCVTEDGIVRCDDEGSNILSHYSCTSLKPAETY